MKARCLTIRTKGHTVELIGEKEIEGAATFEIRLTKKNGDIELHYFDQNDFVPIKMEMKIETGQAAGQSVETFFSEYEEIDGLVMPKSMEVKMAGQTVQKITFKEVAFNEDMEDDYFAYPKK